ncbi:3-deoxy-manno-octulosonate cytidylyltransferase [bacterium]|nr:3-deoxy-manno-octulosonate cytidylyltransferase [candidate division CSSED10-310 bacterium]
MVHDPVSGADNRTVIVIPARYGSSRFPGKPLAKIGDTPMIVRVWQQAMRCKSTDQVIVATDHPAIQAVVEVAGGQCVMTPSELPSGTDRIAAALAGVDADIVVNLQGDEPLIDPHAIDIAVAALINDETAHMSTLATPILDQVDFFNPNVVKVVFNRKKHALYFSRSPIPFQDLSSVPPEIWGYRHIGLYAFRKSWLDYIVASSQADMEKTERLEQLRTLYLGGIIRVDLVDQVFPGVDTPEDIAIIESLLMNQ